MRDLNNSNNNPNNTTKYCRATTFSVSPFCSKELSTLKTAKMAAEEVKQKSFSSASKSGNAATGPSSPSTGSGQVHTTGLFRMLNFELYAKPNKVVMIPGVILFMGCVGYLTYLNLTEDRERKTYMALNEQGALVKRERKSRWE